MDVDRAMRLQLFTGDDAVQLVGHCAPYTRVMQLAINASNLSDPVEAVRNVLDLLGYTMSDEFAACGHSECNVHIDLKTLRAWMLTTVRHQPQTVRALCAREDGGVTIVDLLKVSSYPLPL